MITGIQILAEVGGPLRIAGGGIKVDHGVRFVRTTYPLICSLADRLFLWRIIVGPGKGHDGAHNDFDPLHMCPGDDLTIA